MWPHDRGIWKSITYDGRTYSSIPGVPIQVADFDAPVLQAIGIVTDGFLLASVELGAGIP
jgi:hypothetical protein